MYVVFLIGLCLSDCPANSFLINECTENCSCTNNRLNQCSVFNCNANDVCDMSNKEEEGQSCIRLYRDCKDIYDNLDQRDGIYKILPSGWTGQSFDVFCDMDNGGGWTVSMFQLKCCN